MTETDIVNLALSNLGGKPLAAGTYSSSDSTQAVVARKWFATARDEALRGHPWNFARKRANLTTTYTSLSGVALAASGDGEIAVAATAHGLTTGNRVYLKDVEGVTAANGRWKITRIDNDTFVLDDSVFSGSHTSGTGSWVQIPAFGWDFQHTLPTDCLRVLRCNGYDSADDDSVNFEIEQGKLLIDDEEVELAYVFQNTTTSTWTADFSNAFAALLASYMAQDLSGAGAVKAGELRQMYEKILLPGARTKDARESKPRTPPNYHHGSTLYKARWGGCRP